MSEQELIELRIINKISEIFLTVADERMYGEVLDVVLESMQSEFGTFGYFSEDGSYVAPAVTRKIYWDQCQIKDKELALEKSNCSDICKKSLESKKAYYDNTGPFKTPKGHIPIYNTIFTPIIFRGEIVSAIRLANKQNGYNENDRALLEKIADHIASVLSARLERDNKEKELEGIFNLSLDMMCVSSIDGQLLKVNPAWEKTLGYTTAEIMELGWEELIHSDDLLSVNSEIEKQHKGNPILSHVDRYKCKDGTYKSLEWNAIPSGDKVYAIARDITDHQLAEEKLKENEMRLRLSMNAAKAGSWSWNIETDDVVWDERMQEIFGFEPGTYDGTYESWKNVVHPEDVEEADKQTREALEKGTNYDFQYRLNIKSENGHWRTVRAQAIVLSNESDERIRMAGLCVDITDQKKAEKEKENLEIQLRQATKMQAVGTLAGGVAHEFNNLLGVIMGCTDLARDETLEGSFARGQLDKVLRASYRAKNLVKQILTFSRQSQQQRISANLSPLIKESVSLIRTSIPSSIEVKSNLPTGYGNTMVDPTEIQQIVMNFCSNAVWAMKENGILTISLNEVNLTNHDELIPKGLSAGSYLKLSFSDTGCGMDTKTISQIFDPFFTTKEVGQGTGMGLSIVYGIIESYGGTITVESEVGTGTTFYLYFPVTEKPVAKELVNDVEEQGRGERILFVDDEEMYAEMSAKMLNYLGYDVDFHINSQKALGVFKAAPESYDLIVTDQIMPDLSGEELVKEIRSIRPEIPIILCTGYSTQMNEKKAKALGINAFAFKPIVKKDIALLIRSVLDAKNLTLQGVEHGDNTRY